MATPRIDSQLVEILGRNRLVVELVQAGIEVATPFRDRGIDLIAYSERDAFAACPLQLKVSSGKAFGVDRKYAKIPSLLLIYIWHYDQPSETEFYALTYEEAVSVAEAKGWTKTLSWERGAYSTPGADKKLVELLLPYRMTNQEQWQHKITKRANEMGLDTPKSPSNNLRGFCEESDPWPGDETNEKLLAALKSMDE